MNRYTIKATLGEHAYGLIMKGENNETKEQVIIKQHKKKYYTWEECMALKEIKVLRIFNNVGVQKLKELIREKDILYSVYEYTHENLFEYYQDLRNNNQIIQEIEIKQIMHQIFSALNYVHSMGYMHRDLCLENIFINEGMNIKIGNFYSAREQNSRPPLTDYITTRWYRAPEQLLHSTAYTIKIDMWAVGCVMAELFLLGPLFGGTSESDQLFRIVKILGTPTDWAGFYQLTNNMKVKLPDFSPQNMHDIIPNASKEAVDLIQKLLVFNPSKRYTSLQCLKHPFFTGQKLINVQNQSQSIIVKNSSIQPLEKQEQISEEESQHGSSPKSEQRVPKNILEMNLQRPISRDCNRDQKENAQEIKARKEIGEHTEIKKPFIDQQIDEESGEEKKEQKDFYMRRPIQTPDTLPKLLMEDV